MKALKSQFLYFFIIIGLTANTSAMAVSSAAPLLGTQNNRNILPPDEIKNNNNLNNNNTNNSSEDTFRKQLNNIAARQELVGMAQKQNNNSKNTAPTENFFNSLTTCTAGTFYETNTLAAFVGPSMLAHNIIGVNGAICEAKLMTPEGNFAFCVFDIYALDDINDQYMIEGLVNYDFKNTSQQSIRAELSWSGIKIQHCLYSKYPDLPTE